MKKTDPQQYPPQAETPLVSDDTIIQLYWQRNEDAIKLTDEKYKQYLYSIAYRILHDELDCEECLNDTYLGTWHRIPPAKPNPLQLFLAKLMRNIAIDKFRQRVAAKRIPSEMTVSLDELDDCLSYAETPAEAYDKKELASLLNGYLRSLTDRQEFAFVCRYYYSDKIEDIAKMLDVGVATIYRELKTVREGLRACLEKEGYVL